MKEVREAARSGGQVSASAVKALGGFAEFQSAFAKAQREMAASVREMGPGEAEKAFRARVRITDQQAKVRLAESARVIKEEAANAARGEADQRREAEETLRFRQRMWGQQAREAAAEGSGGGGGRRAQRGREASCGSGDVAGEHALLGAARAGRRASTRRRKPPP